MVREGQRLGDTAWNRWSPARQTGVNMLMGCSKYYRMHKDDCRPRLLYAGSAPLGHFNNDSLGLKWHGGKQNGSKLSAAVRRLQVTAPAVHTRMAQSCGHAIRS